MLIYRSGQKIYAEVYRTTRFGHQFGYHQHLPGVVDTGSLTEVSLVKANSYWQECMRRLTGSTLVVLARYLVRNVTVAYARWWHTVAGATCGAEHVSGLVFTPKERRGPKILPCLRSFFPRERRKEVGGSSAERREALLHLPVAPSLGPYFEEIGLGAEETMAEVQVTPSSQQRKETTRSNQRVGYKYPQARRFIADLMTTHTPEELQDLLADGLEFPELGMVKIEVEHPVPGLDQLHATLEARRSTRFDLSASAEEEYVEEIDLDTFSRAMLMRPTLEPGRIIPPSPEPESIPNAETVNGPRASGVDKGKGIYLAPSKKAQVMRPKGFVIGTPAVSILAPEEEEEEEMPEDISHALPAADVPLASLSEEEQLALALRASIDTVREEQAAHVANFIFDQPAGMLLHHFRLLHSLLVFLYGKVAYLSFITLTSVSSLNFAAWLLPGETSEATAATEEDCRGNV